MVVVVFYKSVITKYNRAGIKYIVRRNGHGNFLLYDVTVVPRRAHVCMQVCMYAIYIVMILAMIFDAYFKFTTIIIV